MLLNLQLCLLLGAGLNHLWIYRHFTLKDECRWDCVLPVWRERGWTLSFFSQDHLHNIGVPPDPLPTLLRVLLLQWVDVRAAGSADLLGCAHPANGCQIPARQRKKTNSITLESLPWISTLCKWDVSCFLFFFLPRRQDIVQDERSDKEETESDDEDQDLRDKSKNGHMLNGHIPFNNNHKKRNWLCARATNGGKSPPLRRANAS